MCRGGLDARCRLALALVGVPLLESLQRRLGTLEMTARVAEVVVIETDPSVKDVAARLGQVKLEARVVQRCLQRVPPGMAPNETGAETEDQGDQNGQQDLAARHSHDRDSIARARRADLRHWCRSDPTGSSRR